MSTNAHLRKFYNEADFSTWAGGAGLLDEEVRILSRRPLPESPDTRILELGTGSGRMLFDLRTRGYQRLTGIDISERMIEVASARSRELGAGITFEVQDVTDLSYPDGSFDVVIGLAQILSHIETIDMRRRTLAHVQRLLPPGGLFYLSVLNWEGRRANPLIAAAAAPFKLLKGDRHAFSRYHLPLLRVAGRLNLRFAWERQPYVVFFTREQFEREMTEAGFEIIELASARTLADGGKTFVPGGYLFAVARRK